MVGFDAPRPEYTRGGQVSLLVGLQDISLDPVLTGILPSGLRVYQCPFVDVWGSSIACAGPHPGEGVGLAHRTFDTDSSSSISNITSNERPSG